MVAAGTEPNMVAAGIVPNMVAAGTGQALSDMAADTVAAGIWVTGCSAIAPLPTWRCNRNSGMRDSTADSQVRPGLGGVAVSSSAGSDRQLRPLWRPWQKRPRRKLQALWREFRAICSDHERPRPARRRSLQQPGAGTNGLADRAHFRGGAAD